jgi:sarcosine dehydrogenase
MIITGTAFGTHDMGWLEKMRHEHNYSDVEIKDITPTLAVFGIWGPNARKILRAATTYDMSHENFPFMHSRIIDLAGNSVRATRVTYVGELGWELYVPIEAGAAVWDSLIVAGELFDLRPCGYRAIESLRLEKGYRAWGVEISTETTPFEAGLGFAVAMKKVDFVGKAALAAKMIPTRKLVPITFDDIRQVPLGNEPIRIGEQIIGRVKSGGQGYTIGKAIGYAYLPVNEAVVGQNVEVEFFGEWHVGTIESEPLFDPESSRIRA